MLGARHEYRAAVALGTSIGAAGFNRRGDNTRETHQASAIAAEAGHDTREPPVAAEAGHDTREPPG